MSGPPTIFIVFVRRSEFSLRFPEEHDFRRTRTLGHMPWRMLRSSNWNLIKSIPLAAIISVVAASGAWAQDSTSVDSAMRNVVTTFSVKSGKLVLSSAANPGKSNLPDGTYTSDDASIMVIVDGRITRFQRGSGETVEIQNVRVTRLGLIALTPSTNALMAVSDFNLPSGTYKSEDGRSSLTVVAGRPTAFTIPGGS